MSVFNSPFVMWVRIKVAGFRRRFDPWYIRRRKRILAEELARNAPYERGDADVWYPPVMSMRETLRVVIERRLSACRYGDGEFEIVDEQKDKTTFQEYDECLRDRLREILSRPLENCLCCIPDIYGPLARYVEGDQRTWRRVALWSREKALRFLGDAYRNPGSEFRLGDALVSRPYLGIADKSTAPKIFDLWKELFADKDLLVVEGRYSRLGVGNDLFDGARSVRRIWCPATNAFGKYEEILSAVRGQAKKSDLIILALGMTATVLAYDLAKEGYWAVDTGHLDVEYMWMRMGVTEKVPIPGRYVNECENGHEHVSEKDELERYHVVATVGC